LTSDPPSWDSNDRGPVIKTTTTGQWANLGAANSIFGVATSTAVKDFTIIHGYKKTPGTAYVPASIIGPRISVSISPTSIMHAQIPQNGGDVIWSVGGTNPSNYISAVAPRLGNDIWAFTCGQVRGMEIWQNGVLLNAAPTKKPSWTSTTSPFAIGKSISDTGSPNFDGDYGEHQFVYIYNRVLTPDEIRYLASNPYGFFPNHVFFKPSYFNTASAGVRSGGTGLLIPNFSPKGGAVVGGRASPVFFDVENLNGGCKVGGTTLISQNLTATGGSVAGGYGYRSWNYISSGGSKAAGTSMPFMAVGVFGGGTIGGTAKLNIFDIVEGITGSGIVGGRALNLRSLAVIDSSGGILGAGVSPYVYVDNLPVSREGVLGAGEATRMYLFNPRVIAERIYVSGSTGVPGSPTVTFYQNEIGNGVGLLAGLSSNFNIIPRFGDGGALVAGSNDLLIEAIGVGGIKGAGLAINYEFYAIAGSGGCVIAGLNYNNLISVQILHGNARVGGAARVQRRLIFTSIHKNYALSSGSDNFLKTLEKRKREGTITRATRQTVGLVSCNGYSIL
jgi:hypothetical protein